MAPVTQRPSWDLLYEAARAQEGYFTTKQAADAGYSSPLLYKHVKAGRIARVRRGVHRLVHFPAGEHEELVVVWLWSEQQGVFSHQTALALHDLSDALPSKIHVTLPESWTRRRLRPPRGVVIYHADLPLAARTWFGAVPVTTPRRTLHDCARANVSPELLDHAKRQALKRHLVTRRDLDGVARAASAAAGGRG